MHDETPVADERGRVGDQTQICVTIVDDKAGVGDGAVFPGKVTDFAGGRRGGAAGSGSSVGVEVAACGFAGAGRVDGEGVDMVSEGAAGAGEALQGDLHGCAVAGAGGEDEDFSADGGTGGDNGSVADVGGVAGHHWGVGGGLMEGQFGLGEIEEGSGDLRWWPQGLTRRRGGRQNAWLLVLGWSN